MHILTNGYFEIRIFGGCCFFDLACLVVPMVIVNKVCVWSGLATTNKRRYFFRWTFIIIFLWIWGHWNWKFNSWHFPDTNRLKEPVIVNDVWYFSEPPTKEIWLRDVTYLAVPLALLCVCMRPWK